MVSTAAQFWDAPRIVLKVLVATLGVLILSSLSAHAGELVVNSAGRKVEVPDKILRVMAAGPPASVLIYVLAPEKLIGWNRKPGEAERAYLAPMVRNLPELGRLTGRGDTANLEVVLKAKPDVVIDFGSVAPTYMSLADRVQAQTGVPYLLIDGRFSNSVAALQLVGRILGVEERSERLARSLAQSLAQIDGVVQSVPEADRPRVYLARGANGLDRQPRVVDAIIELAGGMNVVGTGELGGIVKVSLEQVAAWNPDTIVTTSQIYLLFCTRLQAGRKSRPSNRTGCL